MDKTPFKHMHTIFSLTGQYIQMNKRMNTELDLVNHTHTFMNTGEKGL